MIMKEIAKILETQILSHDHHFPLKKITFTHLNKNGEWKEKKHDVYHLGNAAAVLLYNKEQKTVILIKQFRIPSFINGNEDGMLVEACAGKLDKESPEEGIKREIEEETGYKVPAVQKIMEAYMSPGYMSELIYFFTAEYDASMKVSDGGGLQEEEEEVEVMEMPFQQAILLMKEGKIKDAKTIMLLQYAQLNKLIAE
jgi:nudix-type nucleoside diphosphatase (YffH/AdpP family)